MSDLISRQAAIRWVKTECNPYGKPTLDYESGKKVIEHLERMSSAEPERKKGKWIEVNDAYNRISGRCSACGWETHMYEDDVVGMPFCPFCGADMREEGQND